MREKESENVRRGRESERGGERGRERRQQEQTCPVFLAVITLIQGVQVEREGEREGEGERDGKGGRRRAGGG